MCCREVIIFYSIFSTFVAPSVLYFEFKVLFINVKCLTMMDENIIEKLFAQMIILL